MIVLKQSAGDGVVSDSATQTGTPKKAALAGLSLNSPCRVRPRSGETPVCTLIEEYMLQYSGRDTSRGQRLRWWQEILGELPLRELTDDHVHAAVEELTRSPSRYYAGKDAAGAPIYKAKRQALAPATLNRYVAALAAVITWSMKRRFAPIGFVHPCKTLPRQAENNEQTRFLSDEERERLLIACRASKWAELYLLVLLALTTGARKSELLNLRWEDVDTGRQIAYCGRSKNGDPKALPLVPTVVELMADRQRSSGLLFASKSAPSRPYAFEARWREAMRLAKLRSFRFHDLRHTCASMLAQNGATLLEIADVLGHRQLQVTKRYSHLTTTHKAALVNRVLGGIR
jgi:integrase